MEVVGDSNLKQGSMWQCVPNASYEPCGPLGRARELRGRGHMFLFQCASGCLLPISKLFDYHPPGSSVYVIKSCVTQIILKSFLALLYAPAGLLSTRKQTRCPLGIALRVFPFLPNYVACNFFEKQKQCVAKGQVPNTLLHSICGVT